jgi:hypothetical protein
MVAAAPACPAPVPAPVPDPAPRRPRSARPPPAGIVIYVTPVLVKTCDGASNYGTLVL